MTGRKFRVCRFVISYSILVLLSPIPTSGQDEIIEGGSRECYNAQGKPQLCFPPFQNDATRGANITATNTCGSVTTQFCRITSSVRGSENRQYEACEAPRPGVDRQLIHPPEHIIDRDEDGQRTWWQSDTMEELHWTTPHSINITISLGKAYDVTFVQVLFHSLRPDSWIIHKSHDFGKTWTTYQYFSRSCFQTYRMRDLVRLIRANRYEIRDKESICTSKYSDRIPISGGTVVYGTLDDKANRSNFIENAALREWVTATDIRLEFTRMNTFGDEIFGGSRVHQCYYYSVESASIGGRCKCNGHASECIGEGIQRHCVCQHNTTGTDCERCADFFVDRPWAPATYSDPGVCQSCQCYGHTKQCRFNESIYIKSGYKSGGECLDCQDHTRGFHCEHCLAGYYRDLDEPPTESNPCKACQCTEEGTNATYCNEIGGGCSCRLNTRGRLCQLCVSTAYNFGSHDEMGCSDCDCFTAGTVAGNETCNNVTGQCHCKENVEGRQCDVCRDSFYGLDANDPKGCRPCECSPIGSESPVCNKHTGMCTCKQFLMGQQCNQVEPGAYIPYLDENTIEAEGGLPGNNTQFVPDFDAVNTTGSGSVLVSGPGSITWRSITVSRSGPYLVIIRYSLADMVFWERAILTFERGNDPAGDPPDPQLCMETGNVASLQFDEPVPGQVTFHKFPNSICLRSGVTYQLMLMTYGENNGNSPIFIDSIVLFPAPGFVAPGIMPGGSSYEDCLTVRASVTAANTIVAECRLWEEEISSMPSIIKPCNCDPVGAKPNYTITRSQCMLSGGQCYCKDGVTGRRCDRCAAGFFGHGLNGCSRCMCDIQLSVHPNSCNQLTGRCQCLAGADPTRGINCDHCLEAHFRSPSGFGCDLCGCNRNGAVNTSCDERTGQCFCKEGVTGRTCDTCIHDNQFLNFDGCQPCECKPDGSNSLQCDANGVCSCRANVMGQHCQNCMAGHYGLHKDNLDGCLPCFCYGHSRQCLSSPFYNKGLLQTLTQAPENSELDKWHVIDNTGLDITNLVQVQAPFGLAAEQLRSDQELFAVHPISNPNIINTYGRSQKFLLRMEPAPLPQQRAGGDIFFISGTGQTILARFDHTPSASVEEFSVPLVERFWQPPLTSNEFRFFLTNVSELRIRLAYASDMRQVTRGYLAEVRLPLPVRAQQNMLGNVPWVELCTCPPEYDGPHCEFCASGFRREVVFGNKMSSCIPCDCHGHSSSCKADSGECENCMHNTEGYSCERCAPHFYGNATVAGDTDACQRCGCNRVGTVKGNGNVAPCDHMSGQCNCKRGVTGRQCDTCQDTFYNFGISGCQPCDCNTNGSVSDICDHVSGQCRCVGNVIGRTCDRCPENFFNHSSGCLECPICYGLIANATNTVRQNISTLERTLRNLIRNPDRQPADHAVFNMSVFTLLADVKLLWATVQPAATRSLSLQQPFEKLLTDLIKLQQELDLTRTEYELTVTQSEIAMSAVSDVSTRVNNLTTIVSELLTLLRGDVTVLLRKAETLFTNQTGEVTRVRRIADDAEELANNMANRTMEIEKVATVAIALTGEAENSAGQVNTSVHTLREDLQKLEEKMKNDLVGGLDDEESHSVETRRQVETAVRSAETIFNQAGTTAMERSLAAGQELSEKLSAQLDALERGLPILSATHEGQRRELLDKTEVAIPAMGEHARMLSQLRNLSRQARALDDMVKTRRDFFGWAKQMESVIKDFHDTVVADRARAEQAAKRVEDAENMTRRAEQLLRHVEGEMNTTRNTIASTFNVVNETLTNLGKLSEAGLPFDAARFKDVTAALATNISHLTEQANDLLNKSTEHRSHGTRRSSLLAQLHMSVEQAGIGVREVQVGVNETLPYLERFETALTTWRADFIRLSTRLSAVKRQIKEVISLRDRGNLENLVNVLEAEENQLDKEVTVRSKMVEHLKKKLEQAVKNSASLPVTCNKQDPSPTPPEARGAAGDTETN